MSSDAKVETHITKCTVTIINNNFQNKREKTGQKKMLPVNKNQQPPRQQSPSALSAKFKECS